MMLEALALLCTVALAITAVCAVQQVRLLRKLAVAPTIVSELAAPLLSSTDDEPRHYASTVEWLGGARAPIPEPPAGEGWRLDAASSDGRNNLLLFWSRSKATTDSPASSASS
jgi:hypothetical protein